jgi:hypothetical protein
MILAICVMTALIMITSFTVGYLIKLTLEAILIRIISIQELLKQSEATQHRIDCKLIELMPKKESSTEEYLKEYYNIPDVKEEIIKDCLSKEAEHNPIATEQIHRMAGLPMHEDCLIKVVREESPLTNPKHKHTQEQLNILIKLAGKELTDEQIKIYFSKATNTLVYRYEDVCVKKEYHGKDFLNYTLLKHNRVIRVLYKEDLKEFDKVLFKQEIKEEKIVPEVSEYKEKVKDFMNLKRSTMLPDENLLKKTSLSRKMLHRYATEDELKELKELRKTCQSIGIGKIKKRGLRGSV